MAVGFGSWSGWLEVVVAAPLPSPKAGTEPTCLVCDGSCTVIVRVPG